MCFFAAPLLQELRNLLSSPSERHPSSSVVSILFETPQTESSSLPGQKTYLNLTSVFSFHVTFKKETSTTRAKARSKLVLRAVASQFTFGGKQAIQALVAERSSPLYSVGVSSPLWASQLKARSPLPSAHLDTLSEKDKNLSSPYGYQATTLVLKSPKKAE